MVIKDFDSNGLIFALDKDHIPGQNCSDEAFEHAVLNIMECQNFTCLPLIDRKRARDNTNDLNTRASYKENGGKITRVVRRSMNWEKEEYGDVRFFEPANIPHVDEDVNILDVATHLLSPDESGQYPLVVLVGGTKDHPHALFSMNQFLDERTRGEIIRQLVKRNIADGGWDTPKKREMELKNFLNRDYFYSQPLWTDFNHSEEKFLKFCKNFASLFKQSRGEVPHERQHSETFLRPNSNLGRPFFGRFQVRDIMQHACVGIVWDTKAPKQPRANELAKTMLMSANDFSFLAAYSKVGTSPKVEYALQPYALGTSSKPISIPLFLASDLLGDVVNAGFTQNGEFVAIIQPDKDIQTGEGKMPWPAIITKQELFSRDSMINCLVVATAVEHHLIRERLNINSKEAVEWSLGRLHYICNTSSGRQTKLFNKVKNAVGVENFTNFCKAIEQAKDVRNNLAHGALRPSQSRNDFSNSITLKQFISVFQLREMLGISPK